MIFKKPIIAISTPLIKTSIIIIKISFGSIINLKEISFILFKKSLNKNKINYVNFYINNKIIEKCIVLYFKKPNSYTGEDIFELHLHGNPYLVKKIFYIILNVLKLYKIRIAYPGEFTKRGFLNNKFNVYDVENIYNLINFNNIKYLNNIFNNFNYNFKLKFKKIFFFLKNLKNNILKNFKNNNFKNDIYLIKKVNYIIFKIKNLNFKFKNLNINNSLILLGNTNVGKSTIINNLIKSNIIISNLKGTTRDILSFKLKFKNVFIKIKDSSGFILNFKKFIDFKSIFLSIKNIKFSYLILIVYNFLKIYNFNNYLYYNYIKFKFLKTKFFINLYNKIDFFFIKNFSYIEIFFKKFFYINLKISSKNYFGLNFLYNELKRFSNLIKILKKYNYKSFYFKFLKKSLINLKKSLIFLKKKKFFFFLKI